MSVFLIRVTTGQEASPPPPPDIAVPAEPSLEPAASEVSPAPPPAPTPGAPTLSLAQAVSLALQKNFSLLSAADSVAAARYREHDAVAQFYPKLTPSYSGSTFGDRSFSLDLSQRLPWSGASLTANGRYFTLADAVGPVDKSGELSFTLTQPLLRGFGPNTTYFDLTNSRRQVQTQQRGFELARQRLALDVAQAFYQVLKQRQLLDVARQSLERSQSLKIASEARMKVGLASKLDVLRAELQASQAQESMVSSQAALESALEAFRLVLGLDPGEPQEPEAANLPTTGVDAEPLDRLLDRAHANRLELQESRDAVNDAERALKLARQNLLPQLDLNLGFIQVGTGDTFGSAFRPADRKVQVFLSTSYPFEQTAERSTRAIAEIDLDASKRALKQREFEIDSDVRASLRTLERLRKSLELAQKQVEFAEQQRRLATLRYQRGLASNFDIVDAEGNLVASRTTLVGLLTDFQVARIDLLRATGTLDVSKEFAP